MPVASAIHVDDMAAGIVTTAAQKQKAKEAIIESTAWCSMQQLWQLTNQKQVQSSEAATSKSWTRERLEYDKHQVPQRTRP